jgi:predicted nucleic acid-binding protein
VRIAFDTSVLVAGLLASHRHHARAVVWMRAAAAGQIEAVASVHALNEVWSVLTKLPVTPPIAGSDARRAVVDAVSRFELVPLTMQLCVDSLDRCGARGLRSGAVFDAVHVLSAEAAGADVMLTFNARDFIRLSVPSGPRVLEPPDPPAVTR